ncbi:MAG: hypothetical protein J6V94_02705 [Lachnospiraceae bacterium]|nr:hypothetical protein [Lachnospiraceae bacterium]
MNLKNILWVRNTGEIIPNAPIADNLLGLKLSGGDIITTATGNPVSIITNKAQNAINTILSYSPKQSGSGDPSPINIRPIEGWTEANLGVNSETPTTTISLGGTYYGFSIDVERGVLTVAHVIYAFTGEEDIAYSVYLEHGRFFANVLTGQKSGTNVPLACSHYKPSTAPVYANNADNNICANNAFLYWRDDSITSGDDMQTYLATQYANGTPVTVVYALATPLELPLTPQTVALLAGANTIWTDGDSLSVTYMR